MHSKTPDSPNGAAKADEVRHQLELLLASDVFRSSKRCQSFLEFVVERTLSGQAGELREKFIGVEVFQRPPGYDSSEDPVVRATAGEVRKRLAKYYLDPARNAELRIEMMSGSYVPEFRSPVAEPVRVPDAAPAAEVTPLEGVPVTAARPGSIRRRTLLALAGTVSLAGGAWWLARAASTGFDRFWSPLLAGSGSVLICVGQAKLYNFPRAVGPEMEQMLDPRRSSDAPTLHLTPDRADRLLRNIRPVWDRYVPLGDAEALSRVAILMDHKAKPYRVRGSAETTLNDLREGAAVLIGAFNNDWAIRMSSDLRFRLARTEDLGLYVVDAKNPGSREWLGPKDGITTGNTEAADFTDYAILSRVFEPTTGRPMVSLGGITHLATAAAGEILTDPARLSSVLESAPAGWDRKNVQIVIETKVIGHGATPPKMLALHVW